MNHSVEAYLRRLPPEKMEYLLQECLQEDAQQRYGLLFPALLQVLLEQSNQGKLVLPTETKISKEAPFLCLRKLPIPFTM